MDVLTMAGEKKNILLLIPTFADEGGTQKMVYELGTLLAERYRVYECSFNAFAEAHVFRNENEVLSLEAPPATGIFSRILSYRKKAASLRRLKEKYQIDITISNLWSADLVSVLSGGRDSKISIGHVNIRGNFQNRLLLKLRRFAGYIYNRMDRVVAVNQYLAEELQEVFDLQKGKCIFINNFIVLPTHQPVPVPRPQGKLRLANFGRLNPIKNHEPLIMVFSKLKQKVPGIQLVIIGAGPLHDQLMEFSAKAGLSIAADAAENGDVVFTGFHPDPYSLLCSSDVFVFSSRSEGFGLVLVEAMYAALPVVTSDCPTGGPHIILEGARGSYQPGRTQPEETSCGYLMSIPETSEPATINQWVEVLEALLKDPAKMKAMGAAAKKRSMDFSRENIKANWFALLDQF